MGFGLGLGLGLGLGRKENYLHVCHLCARRLPVHKLAKDS